MVFHLLVLLFSFSFHDLNGESPSGSPPENLMGLNWVEGTDSVANLEWQYQIVDVDSSWRIMRGKDLDMNQLSPGKYRLRLRIVGVNPALRTNSPEETSQSAQLGKVMAIKELEVDIRPKFYQTMVFRSSLFVTILVLVYTIVILRVRSVSKKNDWLKTEVAERTKELNKEIEEKRLAETDLKKAIKSAEMASQAKSDFLANVSHEIRTPLNGIIGMNELTLETTLTEEQKDYLITAQRSANILHKIINEILDLSKIEAGKLELELEDFNIRHVVADIRRVFRASAAQKKLSVSQWFSDDVPILLNGDPQRVKQILINLLGNAMKFTEKGSVNINVTLRGSCEDGCTVHFEIIDTGIGIPQEKLNHIFESFNQADSSTTRKYGGTGLGLSISKNLTELMKGQIWVESQIGVGSSFHVILPLKKAKTNQVVDSSSVEPDEDDLLSIYPYTKILLAEDNLINQKVAYHMLQRTEAEVTIASNGKEALELLEATEFDLVFMDINMPFLDGHQITQMVRSFPQNHVNRDVVIIAMTANALKGDKKKCIESGMNDYLSKPFSRRMLFMKLHRWLTLSARA